MNTQVDVLVERTDLRRMEVRTHTPTAALRNGQVLLACDRFALSANTITYGVLGDSHAFWQFFPAPLPWGQLPVWGYADVIDSRCEGMAQGERVFGFLPMSSHLVVEPTRVTTRGFVDASEHRSALFATYNGYARSAVRTSSHDEDLQAILRPLFLTSFVLDDYLADNEFFGGRTVLLSSASSKTALGTAYQLRRRGGPRVVGLTSARHVGFAQATACYDAVHPYEEADALALNGPVVYVDFSDDAALRHAVHRRFGPALRQSLRVGATHWSAPALPEAPPGVAPQLFFGPAQIRKRRTEWGSVPFGALHDAAADRFAAAAHDWLRIDRREGTDAFAETYRCVLDGRADPSAAFMVRLGATLQPVDSPISADEHAVMSRLR